MSRGRRGLPWLAAAALFVVAGLAARSAAPGSAGRLLPSPRVALFAGARGLVADLVWLHLYAEFEEGRPAGVLADIELLADLRPDSDESRDFLAHWVAFGMVRAEPSPSRRLSWWIRGLKLWLEGLQVRPASVALHLGLGEALWIRRDQPTFRGAAESLLEEPVREAAHRHLRAALGAGPRRVVPALFLLAVESWGEPGEAATLLEECRQALESPGAPRPDEEPGGVRLEEAVVLYLELARIENRLARSPVAGEERAALERRQAAIRKWIEGDENPFVVPRTDPR